MIANRTFSSLVERGTFPDQVEVPLDEPFVNSNGRIQNILLEKFTSAAIISSAPGAVRANHYHKTDWHYSFVVTGSVWYYWRAAGSDKQPLTARFGPGQMFFTPPLVEHAMFFPEETSFITFAKNVRDHEHHESDLVRVPLITVRKNDQKEGGWEILFSGTP